MLNAQGWHLQGEPEAIRAATMSEVMAVADRMGYAAVRIALGSGAETFRRIGGEWVCTASR